LPNPNQHGSKEIILSELAGHLGRIDKTLEESYGIDVIYFDSEKHSTQYHIKSHKLLKN